MNKIKSYKDLSDRYCWDNGRLYQPGEHPCPLSAFEHRRTREWQFHSCYDQWAEHGAPVNSARYLNWAVLENRHEWDERE